MMDFLSAMITEQQLSNWEALMDNVIIIASFVFLGAEFIRYALLRQISWRIVGDTLTNYITYAMSIGLIILLFLGLYDGFIFNVFEFALFDIPTTGMTVLLCILLADLMYYWEHRFSHRVNFAWATHMVHHSSNHYNMSVATRFGPMDGFWSVFFMVPLIFLGFSPLLVLFSHAVVLGYQTFLHTEAIGKLPRWIEYIFNTPSHHRVHHGANAEYIDKNYGGILIIWDRLFGSFAEEKAEVRFGLVDSQQSLNPFVVFFQGFYEMIIALTKAKSLKDIFDIFCAPPEVQEKFKEPVIKVPAE